MQHNLDGRQGVGPFCQRSRVLATLLRICFYIKLKSSNTHRSLLTFPLPELPLWCLPFCLPSLASELFWSVSFPFAFPSWASALFPFRNSLYLRQDQDIWALVKNGAISQSRVLTSPYLFDCPSCEVGEICIRS